MQDAMTDKTEAPKDSINENDAEKKGAGTNAVWMGTAVGVGSAALVAALMYASRRNKKK
jgi:hypothetical protein